MDGDDDFDEQFLYHGVSDDSDDSDDSDLEEELFDWSASDSDEEGLTEVSFICFVAASMDLNVRETYFARQRVIWSEHVRVLHRENMFGRTYRMDEDHFDRLLSLLSPHLHVDALMSTKRTGVAPISAEVVLHCTLRYLAGGSYLDIRQVAQVSVPSFYRCLNRGISAIMRCSVLNIALPTTASEINRAAASFKVFSTEGVLDGCVGCVDGMLVKIATPSRKDADGNVRCYFSGHYHHMGLNIQAACDHMYRFTFFSVAAPGGSSDLWAYARTALANYAENLPDNRYLIGDGAYTPSEHMLTPFGGAGRINRAHDTFDFYVSQLRIKIEQTFGKYCNKWRCVKLPLPLKLRNASRVLMAMARLHNFCITLPESFELSEAMENVNSNQSSLYYFPSEPSRPEVFSIEGVSDLRDRLVQFIQNRSLSRPYRNIVRRAEATES